MSKAFIVKKLESFTRKMDETSAAVTSMTDRFSYYSRFFFRFFYSCMCAQQYAYFSSFVVGGTPEKNDCIEAGVFNRLDSTWFLKLA